MPIDPKDFFLEYVLEPYDAWINQELCKWKAMAVANGLNALMEVKFLHDYPTRTVTDSDHDQALGNYRRGLTNWQDHRHIRFVAETFKHVERRKKTEIPGKLGDMEINPAGPFGPEFDQSFDTVRDQLGFPYQETPGGPSVWVPLREVATRCVDYWRGELESP